MKVFIKEGVLTYFEGSSYYDLRESFEVDKLVKLIEEVGVRGGHIGWSLAYKKLGSNGEWYVDEYQFGRSVREAMEMTKDLIEKGKLKIEYELRTDVPTRCF